MLSNPSPRSLVNSDTPHLARRPYDLRHAAASLWLNAGVPATEVARRLGQGVAVLLRVYANCIDGTDHDNNQRIGTALG
jgi:integrase